MNDISFIFKLIFVINPICLLCSAPGTLKSPLNSTERLGRSSLTGSPSSQGSSSPLSSHEATSPLETHGMTSPHLQSLHGSTSLNSPHSSFSPNSYGSTSPPGTTSPTSIKFGIKLKLSPRKTSVENTSLDGNGTLSHDCGKMGPGNTVSANGNNAEKKGERETGCVQDSTVSSGTSHASRLSSQNSHRNSEMDCMRYTNDLTNPTFDFSLRNLENSRYRSKLESVTANKNPGSVTHDLSGITELVNPCLVIDSLSTSPLSTHRDLPPNQSISNYSSMADNDITDEEKMSARKNKSWLLHNSSRLGVGQDMGSLLSTTVSSSFMQKVGDQTITDDTLQDINQSFMKDQEMKLHIQRTLDVVEQKIIR